MSNDVIVNEVVAVEYLGGPQPGVYTFASDGPLPDSYPGSPAWHAPGRYHKVGEGRRNVVWFDKPTNVRSAQYEWVAAEPISEEVETKKVDLLARAS